MKSFLPLLCLILLCPVFLQAQSNYKPGFVVTITGDTLQGYINYREWSNTPTAVTFREEANSGAEQEFTPANARYFEVTGMEAYQRYDGMITMNPVALDRISFESKTLLEPVVVFLKINYKGDLVDLLSYTDKLKTRFFFQEKDGSQPQELYYGRYYADLHKGEIASKTGYIGPRQYLVTQKGYVGQIQHLLNKYDVYTSKLSRDVEYAQYVDYDLENLFNKFNMVRVTSPAPKDQKSSSFRYFAGLGLNSSEVRISGFDGLVDPDKNPTSFMPLLALGSDIFLNEHIQKLILRIEGILSASNYHIENEIPNNYGYTRYAYNISRQNFAISPQIIYNLYNTDNLKVYIGAVSQFNFTNYSTNYYRVERVDYDLPSRNNEVIYPNYLKLMPFWFSYAFRAGTVLNKRYEAFIIYTPYSAITQYANSSIEIKSVQVGLNYLFNNN